jgi:hypothetical protein
MFHAPWGWSSGDSIELVLRPEAPAEHCYLALDYYPSDTRSSDLTLSLKGPEGVRAVSTGIPGLLPGAAITVLQEDIVDLGPLQGQEYRISLVIPEACAARIDSMSASLSQPSAEELDAGTARVVSFKPNTLRIQVDARRAGFVVVSELSYPGWEAAVDGKPAALLNGDYLLRTIPVDAGRHDIRLRFRSKSFEWGLAVSFLSLVCAGFMVFYRSDVR